MKDFALGGQQTRPVDQQPRAAGQEAVMDIFPLRPFSFDGKQDCSRAASWKSVGGRD